jgi:hypothetical protein
MILNIRNKQALLNVYEGIFSRAKEGWDQAGHSYVPSASLRLRGATSAVLLSIHGMVIN